MLCILTDLSCKIIGKKEILYMISERIKMLREQYNYSQAELAKKLNIARTSVLAW